MIMDQRGFTLIEILVTTTIISGIAVMVGLFALDISDFGIFLGDTLTAQQELQQTMNVLSAEVRSMGPADTGGYVIASASSSSLTFYSDTDDDGFMNQVRYFLQGTILRKGVIESSGSPLSYNPVNEIIIDVVHDVVASAGAPIFTYYPTLSGGNETPLTYPVQVTDIRLIKTTVSADRTPLDIKGRVTFSVTTKIRNVVND